jgi:hypothetical protein
MRLSVTTLALLCALALAPFPSAAGDARGLTVVELFTSQGCSSCPPADAFLGELAEKEGLLALSFHVDYWDYIGWKDIFADPAFTRRQREYASNLGLRYVYTPQMVIQGSVHVTGSDRPAVFERIERFKSTDRVPVTLGRDASGRLAVSIAQASEQTEAAVWMVVYDDAHATKVRRGENRGRTLIDRNVVRGLRRIGTWTGKAMSLKVELSGITMDPGDGCAVILQSIATGHVLGAAKLALDKSG